MKAEENLDCIFCKIIAGEFGTEFIAQNEHAVAFKDINPQAKVHILCVPKQHTTNVSELVDEAVLSGLFALIREVAGATLMVNSGFSSTLGSARGSLSSIPTLMCSAAERANANS